MDYQDENRITVTVVLAGLEKCDGIPIYTTYRLEVAAGQEQPEGWPAEQSGSLPCLIGSDGFTGRTKQRDGSCFLGFLHRPLPDPEAPPSREVYPRWTPRLPGKGSTAFCYLRWTKWGGPVAVGDGLRENLTVEHQLERNWPVKLELLNPVWCPRAAQPSPWQGGGEEAQQSLPALAYSVVKLTEYGPPRKSPNPTTCKLKSEGIESRTACVARKGWSYTSRCNVTAEIRLRGERVGRLSLAPSSWLMRSQSRKCIRSS